MYNDRNRRKQAGETRRKLAGNYIILLAETISPIVSQSWLRTSPWDAGKRRAGPGRGQATETEDRADWALHCCSSRPSPLGGATAVMLAYTLDQSRMRSSVSTHTNTHTAYCRYIR